MFRRFQPVNTKNLFPRQGKWLFLLVTVLLFALVATTAAQEEAEDIDPPVLEPIMVERTVTPQGVNAVWTFFPSQDSFLSSAFPNNNYGGLTTMGVGFDSSFYQAMRTVMQFNISSIPTNSIINSARLELYQSGCSPANDVDMGLLAQFMKSSWKEFEVTWANANYLGGDQIGVGNATCALGWKSFDAANVVREWTSGARTNNGFIITGHEGTSPPRTRTYYSRQRAGGTEPKLIIDWLESCDNVAPTAWVEPLPQWSTNDGTISWTGTDSAPSGCTPVGIANYDVQYNINGGSWTTWQQNTTATSATFSEAQNGQTYYLRARATDKAGNVQAWPSSPQAWTTIDAIDPQAQMNALPQYSLGPNFAISWDGSDNAGGSGIATYDVQYREGDGEWVTYITGTTAKSANFGPAQNGVTYSFKARATDVAGNVQPWSENAQTSTTAVNHPVAIVKPFNPIILKPTAPVTTSFTVNWQGFTLSGVTISQYQLQYKVNNGSWTLWGTFPGTQLSAEFNDLVAQDSTYYFEARALTNAIDVEDEQFNNVPEALKVVDLQAPFLEPTIYLPIIVKEGE